MIVVSDTSPLVTLWKMGRLSLIHQLYGEVVIPTDVERELHDEDHRASAEAISTSAKHWLRVCPPSSIRQFKGLNAGEAAAISLAQELNADLLVIDERAGRRIATQTGLKIIGTIGILEVAAFRGLIDLKEAFEQLQLSDFWVNSSFLESRLIAFDALKKSS